MILFMKHRYLFLRTFFVLCMGMGVMGAVDGQAVILSDRSGYNTASQVVGSRRLFERHFFQNGDFASWLNLLDQSRAVEWLQDQVKAGKMTQLWVATAPIRLGNLDIAPGQGVTYQQIASYLPYADESPYSIGDFQKLLVEKKVLSSKGYLEGLKGENGVSFESVNFSFLAPKLKKIPLPIKNGRAQDAFLADLHELLMLPNCVLESTSVETTRYQSRNTNMFMGIFESIGGNMIAGALAPDRYEVRRIASVYTTRVSVESLYDLHFGFSPYPNYVGRPGILSINGAYQLSSFALSFLAGDKTQVFQSDITGMFGLRGLSSGTSISGTNFPYFTTKFGFLSLQNPGYQTQYVRAGLGFGTAFNAFFADMDYGLVYATGTHRNALGMSVGLNGEYTFAGPLSWIGSLLFLFQPNGRNSDVDGNTTNWRYLQFGTGLAYSMGSNQLTLGYQYRSESSQFVEDQGGGIVFGAKVFF